MLSIGLTGGIGTGKSLVSNLLNDLGATIVNADLLGHEAYLPDTVGFDMVVDAFGDQIVGEDGTVDRKKLGPIVFSSPQNMSKLNAIMHPRYDPVTVGRILIKWYRCGSCGSCSSH